MDHQNPYANIDPDKEDHPSAAMVEGLISELSKCSYVDVSRKEGQKQIRNRCHDFLIHDNHVIKQVVKSTWWAVARRDLADLPLDFFDQLP